MEEGRSVLEAAAAPPNRHWKIGGKWFTIWRRPATSRLNQKEWAEFLRNRYKAENGDYGEEEEEEEEGYEVGDCPNCDSEGKVGDPCYLCEDNSMFYFPKDKIVEPEPRKMLSEEEGTGI